MTKIYSIDRLIAEHDSKDVGTIGREILKFRKENLVAKADVELEDKLKALEARAMEEAKVDEANPSTFEGAQFRGRLNYFKETQQEDRYKDTLTEIDRAYEDLDKQKKEGVNIVYHDEQIPVDTRYKQEDVAFEYNVPRWSGATVPGTSKNCKVKYPNASTPLSVFMGGDGRSYQTKGEIEQQGKVWRSSRDFTITMIAGRPPRTEVFDHLDKYDYMWRVFDKKAQFTDIGRKIDIKWGGDWNTAYGSKAIKNIWEEDVKRGDFKFYDSHEAENLDLSQGDWQSVVEAHAEYFSKILYSVKKRYRDSLPEDESRAVAMHAICEFAKRLVDTDEPLRARFFTAAYKWVLHFYREALDTKDVINNKPSKKKLEDRRTLNDFLRDFKKELFRMPTIEEICKGTGWGKLRVESTWRIFDFNVNAYRDMNYDEMLYTVMDEKLSERQATILEMNFGLNGSKSSIDEIAEELDLGRATVQRERVKAMELIKSELGDLF